MIVPGIPQRILANVRSHLKLAACCTRNPPLNSTQNDITSAPPNWRGSNAGPCTQFTIEKSTIILVAVHIISSKAAMPFCFSPALV